MTHKLKLLRNFVEPILLGEKTFEVRENDRGFQKGDKIKFEVVGVADGAYYVPDDIQVEQQKIIERMTFSITYVISGWGIKNGYVVFGIEASEIDGGNEYGTT